MTYICTNCGYVYDEKVGDPNHHIPPSTLFKNLPESWICPICYVAKNQFDCLE